MWKQELVLLVLGHVLESGCTVLSYVPSSGNYPLCSMETHHNPQHCMGAGHH